MDASSYGLSLLGGALIGLAAALLLWLNGRVAGVSGMISGIVMRQPGDTLWRVLLLAGLFGAGLMGMLVAPEQIGSSPRSLGVLALAGLLVGAGTRWSKGCTSGHGVCGVGRLSPRSLAATATFVVTGVLTVLALRLLGGGT